MRECSRLSVPCLPPCRTWLAVRVRGARTVNSRNRSSERRNVASCRTSSSAISPPRLSALKRQPRPWIEPDVPPGSPPTDAGVPHPRVAAQRRLRDRLKIGDGAAAAYRGRPAMHGRLEITKRNLIAAKALDLRLFAS